MRVEVACYSRPARISNSVPLSEIPRWIRVLNLAERPVSATADHTEIRNVTRVEISQVEDLSVTLLCDPEHNFEERILKEQFEP